MLPLALTLVAAAAPPAQVAIACEDDDLQSALIETLEGRTPNVLPVDELVPRSPKAPRADVDALLAEGLDAFELLEVSSAQASMNEAVSLALARMDEVGPTLIARVFIARAALRFGIGETDEGSEDIRRALNLEPTLDPGDQLPPDARKLVGDLSDELAFSAPATLIVNVPKAATLYVDGKAREPDGGVVTVSPIAPGPHFILVRQDGRSSVVEELQLAAEETTTFSPKSPPQRADLRPEGAFNLAEDRVLLLCTVDQLIEVGRSTRRTVARGGDSVTAWAARAVDELYGAPIGQVEAPPAAEPLVSGEAVLISSGVILAAAVVAAGAWATVYIVQEDGRASAVAARREVGNSTARQVILGF